MKNIFLGLLLLASVEVVASCRGDHNHEDPRCIVRTPSPIRPATPPSPKTK